MPFAIRLAVAGSVLAVLAASSAPKAMAQTAPAGATAVTTPAADTQSVAPKTTDGDAVSATSTGPAATPNDAAEKGASPAGATAEPAAPATPSVAATEAKDAAPALTLDVAAALERLGPKAQIDKRDRAGLLATYEARKGAPIWVTGGGASADAAKLAAEIRNADAWGLKSSAFDLPKAEPSGAAGTNPTADALADTEVRLSLAVLKYARHARGGRVEPTALTKFLDRKSQAFEPASVLAQIATAADPGEYLRNLHPRHPQFVSLRQKYVAMRKGPASEKAESIAPMPADGPALEPGTSHADVAVLRKRLGVPSGGQTGEANAVYDDALAVAVKKFQTENGIKPANGTVGKSTRRALNGSQEAPLSAPRLLANMEQWRWMPDDLGTFHVWVNVPEYLIRVVSNGRVIHTERVVVGKLDTQTPIFSDEMEQVIFHPFWGVPESIKTMEVLPSLKGNGAVLAKHNLKLQLGGKDIDPKSVDWSKTDIRKFHVYQPPGGDNVLGVVKFRFPNKHDVYMHDTPSKSLFKTAVRTFSHGCMRVQDPVKLAELLLAEDKKMQPDKVRGLTKGDAPPNNQVNLSRRIPVHVTYFTASVDPSGKVSTFKDVYGHEERVLLGLDGKMHLVKPVPEPKGPAAAEAVGQLAEIKVRDADWSRAVFSGGN